MELSLCLIFCILYLPWRNWWSCRLSWSCRHRCWCFWG